MRTEIHTIKRIHYIYTLKARFKNLIIAESEIEFIGNNEGVYNYDILNNIIEFCMDSMKAYFETLKEFDINEDDGFVSLFDFKDILCKYLGDYFTDSDKLKPKYSDLKIKINDISEIKIELE